MIRDKDSLAYKLAEELAPLVRSGDIATAETKLRDRAKSDKLPYWICIAIVDTARAIARESSGTTACETSP